MHRRDSGPSGWNLKEDEKREEGDNGFRNGLRLPQLPLARIQGDGPDASDEDEEPPRAGAGPGGLPLSRFESSDTARSL